MTEMPQPRIAAERSAGTPTLDIDGRSARLRAWRGLGWPINEILLCALARSGRSDADIGTLCGVDAEAVRELRERYGVG